MPGDTLTADELRAITGKAQPKSQATALARGPEAAAAIRRGVMRR